MSLASKRALMPHRNLNVPQSAFQQLLLRRSARKRLYCKTLRQSSLMELFSRQLPEFQHTRLGINIRKLIREVGANIKKNNSIDR